MKKYSVDLRPYFLDLINNFKEDEFTKIDFEAYKDIDYLYENKHRANICFDDLEENMHLFLCGNPPHTNLPYNIYEIEVTHLYGGIMFFKLVDFPDEKETYCPFNSWLGQISLYPYEIIKFSDYKLHCSPMASRLVKIVNDDDMTTIGTYSTTYSKEKFPKI